MNFSNVKLSAVAAWPEQYPSADVPEIALVGRSNVGKSSLINCLVNRKKLARTSSTPGKTATINFYNIDNTMNLVDLPGYGYAKVSKTEKEKWNKMINTYLSERENLVQVVQLVDIRHKPSIDDCTMLQWIRDCGFYPVIAATKLDKIAKSKIDEHLEVIRKTLKLDDAILIPFSSEKRTGKEELEALLNKIISEVEVNENNQVSTKQ